MMFEVEVKVTFNFQLLTELDQTKLNWAVTQLKSNLVISNCQGTSLSTPKQKSQTQ